MAGVGSRARARAKLKSMRLVCLAPLCKLGRTLPCAQSCGIVLPAPLPARERRFVRGPWAAGPSQAAALFLLFVRDVSDESGPWDPVCYKHNPGGEFLLPSFLQEKQ